MKIKVWRDPYDCGVNITKKREIDFPTGLTVLVGCNGAGKSTLLMNIKDHCKKNNIPCVNYDNLHDGGHGALSEMFFYGNYSEGSYLLSASEGECVKRNASRFLSNLEGFIDDGFRDDFGYRFSMAVSGHDESEGLNKNVRVILLDALDSGLSVDSLVELREALDTFSAELEKTGLETYLIATANEYELTEGHRCLDVVSGEFKRFRGYNDYRRFIVSSRKKKEDRIDRMLNYIEKRKQTELLKYKSIVEKSENGRKKIMEKYPPGTDKSKMEYMDRRELDDLDDAPKYYLNYTARFLTKEDISDLL